MVSSVCKNTHHKDMCLKKIGLYARSMVSTESFIINILGDLYDYLITLIFFNNIYNIHMSSRNFEANNVQEDFWA